MNKQKSFNTEERTATAKRGTLKRRQLYQTGRERTQFPFGKNSKTNSQASENKKTVSPQTI